MVNYKNVRIEGFKSLEEIEKEKERKKRLKPNPYNFVPIIPPNESGIRKSRRKITPRYTYREIKNWHKEKDKGEDI